MNPTVKQARIAGALYALVALTGPLSLMYIPSQLFVPGAATTTADHIKASESLLRWGMASELLYQALEVFLVLTLYELFRAVNKPLARQMTVLGLLPIPIVFLNVLNQAAALLLVSGANVLAAIDKSQSDALATFFVILHSQGLQVASVFWGLWLFPLGLLIMRCGFIPKLLGLSVMVAGSGYLLGALAPLLLPHYAGLIGSMSGVLELGEPPIILWLLFWGAKLQPASNSLVESLQAPLPD